MHRFQDINIELNVLEHNKMLAKRNRLALEDHGIVAFDIMGAIGSGKTLLIEQLIDRLKQRHKRTAVVCADVAGDDDYQRFKAHGSAVINVNTGKDCHIDAHRTEHAIEDLDLDTVDVLFIENVGNLVCPADFPLGADKRIVVISVTEGDDMVRKHPLIFTVADIIVVNKIDLAAAIEVDPQTLVDDAKKLVPHTPVILTDAKHGAGIDALLDALEIHSPTTAGTAGADADTETENQNA